jgi:hydrogenase maturation protease
MQSGVILFAVGNRSRGDDAIGPLLLERLAPWLSAEGRTGAFELIDDYQLQIEHALDLQGRRLALFIDAGHDTPAPFNFYQINPVPVAPSGSTHSLPPECVLGVYRQIAGAAPPPSFVLCVRGEHFELGEGLSNEAEVHLEAAWWQLRQLCREPDAGRWRAFAGNPGSAAA